MKLPIKWLKEYTDVDISVPEMIERLMWRGFEVASAESEMPGITNVVVGRIEALAKHANADKLQVCSIDTGSGAPLTIVTGASNVFVGALVPVALDGAELAGGVVIHPTVMRGVLSSGMLCSGKELGIADSGYPGADIHGILILGSGRVGQPIAEALGMDDVVLDIELTPNRADCQSIIGMCREAAAAFGKPFRGPSVAHIPGEGSSDGLASVTVDNPELCPRYVARVVTDLVIAPSPEWMQKRLRSVGLRPINNIVDITNYVMIEYGHPMHAFDLNYVENGHIVVRNAREGEVVTTLDGKERPVTPDMLLIADESRGVGIAGIMGGENSEITPDTRAALFEAAVFKASNIRSTARRLRHTTDAASRFIKGVDAVTAYKALERAMELVKELGAGKIVGEPIDVCHTDTAERVISVDWRHVDRILGEDYSPELMAELLATIGITAVVAGDALTVTVPHFRHDIESGIEADWDIAEEVARLYGYDKIRPTLMRGNTFCGKLPPVTVFEDSVKDAMAGQGCYEMYSYNFTGPAVLDALLLAPDSEKRLAVKLLNPFGEDQSLMRTTLAPGMLNVLLLNANRRTGHGRFFEVGNVHFDNNADLPEERKMLGIAFAGQDESFFTLKGAVEELLDERGISDVSFCAGGSEYYHPGQKALVYSGDRLLGELGSIHPTVQRSFGLAQPAYVAELSMAALFAAESRVRAFRALPKFPVVARDIAVVVDESVTAAECVRLIGSASADVLVENAKLFDVYRGANIGRGRKSLALSYTLRSDERTLTDEDITGAMTRVLSALETGAGAELRR